MANLDNFCIHHFVPDERCPAVRDRQQWVEQRPTDEAHQPPIQQTPAIGQ